MYTIFQYILSFIDHKLLTVDMHKVVYNQVTYMITPPPPHS